MRIHFQGAHARCCEPNTASFSVRSSGVPPGARSRSSGGLRAKSPRSRGRRENRKGTVCNSPFANPSHVANPSLLAYLYIYIAQLLIAQLPMASNLLAMASTPCFITSLVLAAQNSGMRHACEACQEQACHTTPNLFCSAFLSLSSHRTCCP